MDDETIIQTIRTNKPFIKDVRNAEIIIQKLVRSYGIKEIKIKNTDTEDIDFIY